MAKLLITYTKSAIGYSKDQKATVRSLGLHKLNSTAIQADTPAIRGMIFKVRHLVKVEEVSDTATKQRSSTVRPIVRPASQATATAPAATKPAATKSTAKTVVLPDLAEETTAEPTAQTVVLPDLAEETTAEPVVEEVAEPAAADDLARIEGIGPKIAATLRAAGIDTFAQLAKTDVASLTEILQAADLRLAAPDTWPEQAALAAAGNWEELQQLQDRLKGGRREE